MSCRSCPCGASRPSGRPGSRTEREQAESAIGYVELYGAYAECEAVYGVDNLLARWDALDDGDRETFDFDPRTIHWPTYVQDIHLPSIVTQARVRTEGGGRTTSDRQGRLREQVLSPDRHLAAFDLENTLIASNVVASYSWLASRRLPPTDRARFVAQMLREGPSLLRPRPSGPQRLPASLLPALRERRRSIRSTPTPGRCSAT